jgi:hypothetical protein
MTVFDQINKNISRYVVSFEDEELAILTRYWNKEKYRKTILLQAGDIVILRLVGCKGSARKYCIDATGAEVILQLAIEDAWLSDTFV